LGQKDEAFARLEEAFAERSVGLVLLRVDPVWDRIRADPRFAALVRRGGVPLAPITLAAVASQAQPAAAQAFTPPRRMGAITLAWQYIDNTGHRLSDGYYAARGQSVSQSILLDADYAITDRLAVTAGIPYVWAKYPGSLPPLSGRPRDACQCWTSGFQ